MMEFNSSRLKEARIYRKMTIEELAEAVGTKKQAISQFENAKCSPEFDTLVAISNAVNFPIDFFYESCGYDSKVGNTYFRALFSSNKKDLNAQRIKTKYLARIQYSLKEYVNFPRLNIPNVEGIQGFDAIAMAVRDFWGLGQEPIVDMVSLLERNGVIVTEFSTDGGKIDAFSQYGEINGESYYCVVLGTDKNSFARRQFNCAHELGHILLHEKFDDLNEINREDFRERETEANKFASAFLLPRIAFMQDLQHHSNKLNYYIEMKRKWKVSIAAMVMRAHDLAITNDNQYQYLMRQITKNNWRVMEPLDDIIIVRQPKALRQAINLILLNDVLTGKQIFQLFSKNGISFPKDVVDEILGLEPDTLLAEDRDTKIIAFPKLKTV